MNNFLLDTNRYVNKALKKLDPKPVRALIDGESIKDILIEQFPTVSHAMWGN